MFQRDGWDDLQNALWQLWYFFALRFANVTIVGRKMTTRMEMCARWQIGNVTRVSFCDMPTSNDGRSMQIQMNPGVLPSLFVGWSNFPSHLSNFQQESRQESRPDEKYLDSMQKWTFLVTLIALKELNLLLDVWKMHENAFCLPIFSIVHLLELETTGILHLTK